jgi:beta-galactosidase
VRPTPGDKTAPTHASGDWRSPIGNQPCGYTSFRYDITSSVKFGTTDNVIAVKTDTSVQPSSRFYAGAGIYRHVRLVATNPVHIDQWATYVNTPAPTTTAATVKVTTTVVNSGSASASVSLQGIVSDPSGKALPAVSAAAQTIAAGASANFAFDVPVANPLLWDLFRSDFLTFGHSSASEIACAN